MMTRRITPRAATFAAVILAGVVAARAQPVSTHESSVEWVAVHSPLIVRAVIEDVREHAQHVPDDGIHRYQTVSARVLETLRGEHAPRLEFVHSGDFTRVKLADLLREEREVLLFLEPWTRSGQFNRARQGYAYTRFPHVVRRAAVLTPEHVHWTHSSIPLLAGNLTVLATPEEAVGAIVNYLQVRGERDPLRGETIPLPVELRGGYSDGHFTFPADAVSDKHLLDDPAARESIVDFATFKQRYSQEPPAEWPPAYTRRGRGYVGVQALEWMAADCDAIVRGVVEDFCFVAESDDSTGNSCGVRMRVLEPLKGNAVEQISFYVTDAGDLEKLRRDGTELVAFLRTRSLWPPAGALGYQTRDTLWDDSVIVLDEAEAEVLFADLTWRRDPQEILARLRLAIERERAETEVTAEPAWFAGAPTRPPAFSFHPPASIAAGSSIAGNVYSEMTLPVDRQLMTNARAWAAASNQDLRWVAARAMVYFQSDENAAILQSLLDDDATWERRDMLHMTGLAYPHEPEFLVRWEAWNVLDGWGYYAPKPDFTVGPPREE